MSETDGVFTFPSNGMWEVEFNSRFQASGSTSFQNGREEGNWTMFIEHSADAGGSWDYIRRGQTYCNRHSNQGGPEHKLVSTKTVINVTDSTQQRCRFKVDSGANGTMHGGPKGETIMTFKKIG